MTDRIALGAVVSVLREWVSLTQKRLQEETQLPQWRFSKLERGMGSEEQRMETLGIMAPYFNKSAQDILDMADTVLESLGGGAVDYDEAVVVAKQVFSQSNGTTLSMGIGDLLEQQLLAALQSELPVEQVARTVARLANALENYERARLLRAQRLEL